MSDTQTAEIVHVVPSTPSLSFAYSPEQTGQWMAKLQEYRRAVLVDGPDYGVIPGTEKPTLLKPGAEKLLLAAGLGFTILKVDDEDSRTHQGVTYRCTIRRGEQIVAECDGYAGYDESRFYTSLADAEAKEKAASARYEKPVRKWKIVEYRAPWNSVMKMAQKRALVGATLNALAASGIFTQDLEDEQPTTTATFNPLNLIGPFLSQLSKDATAELKTWRQEQKMPSPSQMTAQQAAAALVKIGELLAAQSSPNPPAGSAGQGSTQDPPPVSTPPAANTEMVSKAQAQRAHVVASGLDDAIMRPILWEGSGRTSDSASHLLRIHYDWTCQTLETAAKDGTLPDGWDLLQTDWQTWKTEQEATERALAEYEADLAGGGDR